MMLYCRDLLILREFLQSLNHKKLVGLKLSQALQ